jgi:hypothetical protein
MLLTLNLSYASNAHGIAKFRQRIQTSSRQQVKRAKFSMSVTKLYSQESAGFRGGIQSHSLWSATKGLSYFQKGVEVLPEFMDQKSLYMLFLKCSFTW